MLLWYVMTCCMCFPVSENGDGQDLTHTGHLSLHINSKHERHVQTCAVGISAILLIIVDCIIHQTRLASG